MSSMSVLVPPNDVLCIFFICLTILLSFDLPYPFPRFHHCCSSRRCMVRR